MPQDYKFCTTEEEVKKLTPEEFEIEMRMLMRQFLEDWDNGWRPPAKPPLKVVALTDSEFNRAEECMTNPGEPTAAAHRGAALLRKLYGKNEEEQK